MKKLFIVLASVLLASCSQMSEKTYNEFSSQLAGMSECYWEDKLDPELYVRAKDSVRFLVEEHSFSGRKLEKKIQESHESFTASNETCKFIYKMTYEYIEMADYRRRIISEKAERDEKYMRMYESMKTTTCRSEFNYYSGSATTTCY